jgi:hypothetical protein
MAKEECVAPLKGHVSVRLITVNMESLQKRRYCSFQSQKRRGERGRIRYGAETTGKAQVVSALSVPFVLEGLFGEADAEPDLELAADAMGMDVEKAYPAQGNTTTHLGPFDRIPFGLEDTGEPIVSPNTAWSHTRPTAAREVNLHTYTASESVPDSGRLCAPEVSMKGGRP